MSLAGKKMNAPFTYPPYEINGGLEKVSSSMFTLMMTDGMLRNVLANCFIYLY